MQKSAARAQRERWRQAVAAVIAASRRDADVTQEELAKAIGWSRDKLAKVEVGQRRVEFGDIVMIANALDEKLETVIRRILAWNG
jgi:DNA-binding XRE family transcriptional regulator